MVAVAAMERWRSVVGLEVGRFFHLGAAYWISELIDRGTIEEGYITTVNADVLDETDKVVSACRLLPC